MKIKFECACSGCRYKNAPYKRRSPERCLWVRHGRAHSYQWRYLIVIGDQRLVTSVWFRSFDSAWTSANRKYDKLASTITDACR